MSSSTTIASIGKGPIFVSGSNGFLGSHIVQQLLRKGYIVRAGVRNPSSPSVEHLSKLDGAGERLSLIGYGDLTTANFDECVKGCTAVMHVATPLSPKIDGTVDGERDIYKPALVSTESLLGSIEKCSDTIRCLVLTSSMSAIAPRPEPPLKSEVHWSDSDAQKERGSWYGAAKTDQEKLVNRWYESKGSSFLRYTSVCPTMILGPILSGTSNVSSGTMGAFKGWFSGSKPAAPNDSMSFVDVEDCAAQHVAALEAGDGRYMSVVESLHWNDISKMMKELRPSMEQITLYEGEDLVTPTKFDLTRMNSLGVSVKSVRETISDALEYMERVGAFE